MATVRSKIVRLIAKLNRNCEWPLCYQWAPLGAPAIYFDWRCTTNLHLNEMKLTDLSEDELRAVIAHEFAHGIYFKEHLTSSLYYPKMIIGTGARCVDELNISLRKLEVDWQDSVKRAILIGTPGPLHGDSPIRGSIGRLLSTLQANISRNPNVSEWICRHESSYIQTARLFACGFHTSRFKKINVVTAMALDTVPLDLNLDEGGELYESVF